MEIYGCGPRRKFKGLGSGGGGRIGSHSLWLPCELQVRGGYPGHRFFSLFKMVTFYSSWTFFCVHFDFLKYIASKYDLSGLLRFLPPPYLQRREACFGPLLGWRTAGDWGTAERPGYSGILRVQGTEGKKGDFEGAELVF